jgi:hypothetical protein
MKPAIRPTIIFESRLVVALWIFALWFGLTFVPGFGTLLIGERVSLTRLRLAP